MLSNNKTNEFLHLISSLHFSIAKFSHLFKIQRSIARGIM